MKTKITASQAIEILKKTLIPDDFNCETWDEVMSEAQRHTDGIAAALEIDEEYVIIN